MPRFWILAWAMTAISLSLLGQENRTYQTFASDRIVNGHSVETFEKGILHFNIMHRFGPVSQGAEEFFGLDIATYRLELGYGLSDRLSVGVGRSGFQKALDGFAKYRLLWQGKDDQPPVSLTWVSVGALRTQDPVDGSAERPVRERFQYWHQALVARKWSPRISTQLMPALLHRNYVRLEEGDNTLAAIGGAVKYQLSKTVGLNVSAYWAEANALGEDRRLPFSLGFDIQSKGHVFQLMLTNSQGMIGPHYMAYTQDKWPAGDIRIGMNIRRAFRIGGRNYH
jgi:hypothetical protein